ncbi:MAG: hypothetical protein LBT46_12760 [Planctomycetaceae bacterium]|jgi:hypothetical protein|nr:hypothetical protein [Planctomycetaceae bacterium]
MPANPFTVPLPTHTVQPQPVGKATNDDSNGGDVLGLGGALGGGAGGVVGIMIARKIVLENPNLTTTKVTKTELLSGPFGTSSLRIPTERAVRPNGGGWVMFFVIILLFAAFGAFIGAKISKK